MRAPGGVLWKVSYVPVTKAWECLCRFYCRCLV